MASNGIEGQPGTRRAVEWHGGKWEDMGGQGMAWEDTEGHWETSKGIEEYPEGPTGVEGHGRGPEGAGVNEGHGKSPKDMGWSWVELGGMGGSGVGCGGVGCRGGMEEPPGSWEESGGQLEGPAARARALMAEMSPSHDRVMSVKTGASSVEH
jgi:hypothetical protein